MTSAVLERIRIKQLGRVQYLAAVEAMREFTARRDATTPDELWVLEHPPVYTLGQGADPGHGPRLANGIPVVQVERGGEITYHGPGQAVVYALVDLARRGIRVGQFVRLLEQSVIDCLDARGERIPGAPGVYVAGAKIAAIGIRVSKGRTYHGVALNADMDLAPFAAIDPCGYPGLAVTQTRDLGIEGTWRELGSRLAHLLAGKLDNA